MVVAVVLGGGDDHESDDYDNSDVGNIHPRQWLLQQQQWWHLCRQQWSGGDIGGRGGR